MKKLAFLLFAVAAVSVACDKDDNDPPKNSGIQLSTVIEGDWDLTSVKRIQEGDVQGSSYYLDFVTETSSGLFSFQNNDTATITYSYTARTAQGTPYSSGNQNFTCDYKVEGSLLMLFINNGQGLDTLELRASSISQTEISFEAIEIVDIPASQQYEKTTETFNLSRL